MSAGFDLILDTTAPTITWGASVGDAGQRFQVGYLLDEPMIESAQLELSDGRILALVDTGTTLECDLPPDTPDGTATVRAFVIDDVWNRATWTTAVYLTGVVVTTTRESFIGPTPRRPRRVRRRRLRSTATVRVHATAATVARRQPPHKAVIAVSALPHRATARLARSSAGRVGVTWRVQTRRASVAGVRTLGREGTVTRRDGPDLEVLLLL